MARIRGTDTKPELLLRKALWHRGLRYRINYRVQGVRADVAFLKGGVLIFVDGCFWHGCPAHYVKPRNNSSFWAEKLKLNIERDLRQTTMLKNAGWHVLRFWEHEVSLELERVVEDVILSIGR
jgi:DNA mismatch endonuclease (patch repair protein)